MLSKTDYVRRLPASLTPLQVVQRAKSEGVELSAATVYAARRGLGASNSSEFGCTPQERQLLELTMEIGFARSAQLISALRAHLNGGGGKS